MFVRYHRTRIVEWDGDHITLRSGGWQSVTTKRKINQEANQFELGFGLYQKSFDWFVTLPDGREVPFEDGMMFSRHAVVAPSIVPSIPETEDAHHG